MAQFPDLVKAPANSRFVVQGNQAFALGVVHAGYHAADGYPGTPSTEVIDKSLALVQEKMVVGWSVNEAVAAAVGVGHAIAGRDTVVTMKTPGAFQAGDTITTAAFYTAPAGALVFYIASDYVPSSTQHVIDLKYFLSSARIPVLEPRDHQEMYHIAFAAADISRKFNTPVAVLASGILCHSEGLITTGEPRTISPRDLPTDLKNWMGMPYIARRNYDSATLKRIPEVAAWAESSNLVATHQGKDPWGIIVSGECYIIVKEALNRLNLDPSLLSISLTYPLPEKKIKEFASGIKGKIFLFEDGDRFLEEKVQLLGIDVTGKNHNPAITNWKPQMIIDLLNRLLDLNLPESRTADPETKLQPVKRPPAICPGCPYRAFALAVVKLKKKKRIYASFGDIGCSTLLFFLNALDTVLCMGASDSMRQGFVLSRPEMAARTISVIGDSCECHSGLDSTRNAVFRNTPGVKVILDNRITAMTGGQPAPSSAVNLAGISNRFNLLDAVAAEKGRTVVANSYNLEEVETTLKQALDMAEKGEFTTLILEGPCIREVKPGLKERDLEINRDTCKQCGLCGICPGIDHDENKRPSFTSMCSNCGSNDQICRQQCPFNAIQTSIPGSDPKDTIVVSEKQGDQKEDKIVTAQKLPESIRIAIRGVGGQGNLFLGRVLSELALRSGYKEQHIVKGDTHGMAQLGGSVISTFSCGDVFSPVLAYGSADMLVAMEAGEVLQPGFLELLKPGGQIILNQLKIVPPGVSKEDYPDLNAIVELLKEHNVISVDAAKIALGLGDKKGRTANVVILGLLSGIAPFSGLPVKLWHDALKSLSATEPTWQANIRAFSAGRNL